MDMAFHAGTFICDSDGERPDYAYIAEVMAQFSPSPAAPTCPNVSPPTTLAPINPTTGSAPARTRTDP